MADSLTTEVIHPSLEPPLTDSSLQEPPLLAEDPVLADMKQAEEQYHQFRARWQRQAADLMTAQAQVADLEEQHRQLAFSLDVARRQAEHERRQAERQRVRAEKLAEIIKDLHRAIFSGNIYDLVLRACLTITGSTRGLYLTTRGKDEPLQIRAVVDVDG